MRHRSHARRQTDRTCILIKNKRTERCVRSSRHIAIQHQFQEYWIRHVHQMNRDVFDRFDASAPSKMRCDILVNEIV